MIIFLNETISMMNHTEKIDISFYAGYEAKEQPILTHKFYTKLNTQVFLGIDQFVADEYKQECKEALFFIGFSAETIPSERRKFTELSRWNNGEFQYSKRRFGYIPRMSNPDFQKLIAICFSPTMVNQIFACTAEFLIFLYYVFKSYPDSEQFKAVASYVQYATEMYHKHDGIEAEKRARYLWELHTAFSLNSGIENSEDERYYCLPKYHSFLSTMMFTELSDFGTYSIVERDDSEEFYLHDFPRTSTRVPSTEKALFYIPHHSDARKACTECGYSAFGEFSNLELSETSFQTALHTLMMMNIYKSAFRVSSKMEIVPSDYKSFDNIVEAQAFVDSTKVEFEGYRIYFMLKVKETGTPDNYTLQLISK